MASSTPAAAASLPVAIGELMPLLAQLPPEELELVIDEMAERDAHLVELAERYCWSNWSRPEQVAPDGVWFILFLIAGRGAGKTRPGAEWTNDEAISNPGVFIGIAGATKGDVRDVMIEGQSGILACAPPWIRVDYEPSKRRVTWRTTPPSIGIVLSADEPDQFRGPNLHRFWADEPAKWRLPKEPELQPWNNLILATRLKDKGQPRGVATTTPRRVGRSAEMLKDLILGPKVGGKRPRPTPEVINDIPGLPPWERWRPVPDVIVHRWSMRRNHANLATEFQSSVKRMFAGTALEAQEVEGEILDDVEGAVFQLDWIEAHRVDTVPRLVRLLVSVDPSHAEQGTGDGAGIIVGALGEDGDAYIFEDESVQGVSPKVWGEEAVKSHNHHRADAVVIEITAVQTEKKGHPVKDTIKAVDPGNKIKWIEVHASADKRSRAEPVAALVEGGRVHHVRDPARPDKFAPLEDELCSWDGTGDSPNRLDAYVQLIRELLLTSRQGLRLL